MFVTSNPERPVRRVVLAVGAVLMLLGLLSVARPEPVQARTYPAGQMYVADGRFHVDGQPITLKGINVDVDNRLTEARFKQMAEWGMDHVRFRIHWATLEPTPPRWNGSRWVRTYNFEELNSIRRQVRWAWKYGMYAILDNHDCKWCHPTGDPAWVSQSAYNSKRVTYNTSSSSGLRQYFGDQWSDSNRQRHIREFLVWLAQQFKNEPGVAGYELMNEPQPGYLPIAAGTTRTVSRVQLNYAQAVRAADPNRIIFFQTRFGYLPGLENFELDRWAALGNVAADLHDGFGARWGTGVNEDPDDPFFGEGTQKLNNNMNLADSLPWAGTAVAKINHYLDRIESLEPYGIPVYVGELGYGEVNDGANGYWGASLSALCFIGDERISWSARDYRGPRGLIDLQRRPQPWFDKVVEAVNSECPGGDGPTDPTPPPTVPPTTVPPTTAPPTTVPGTPTTTVPPTTVPATTTTTTALGGDTVVVPAPSATQPGLVIERRPGGLGIEIRPVADANLYQVRYRFPGGDTWLTPSSNRFVDLTGLDPAVDYSIQVRALVGVTWRSWTQAVVRPLPPTPSTTAPPTTVAPTTTTAPPTTVAPTTTTAPPTTVAPTTTTAPPVTVPPGNSVVVDEVAQPSPVQPGLYVKRTGTDAIVRIRRLDGALIYQLRYTRPGDDRWLPAGEQRVHELSGLDANQSYLFRARAYVNGAWQRWTEMEVGPTAAGGAAAVGAIVGRSVTPDVGALADTSIEIEPVAAVNRRALFVAQKVPLRSEDQAMAARLEAAGVEVVAVTNGQSRFEDPDEFDLVVVSTSVWPGAEDCGYDNTTTPVIIWDPDLIEDLGMGTARVTSAALTNIEIVRSGHPLTAGRSGSTRVYRSAQKMTSTAVGSGAEVIAREAGNPGRAVVFYYPEGAKLANGVTAVGARYGLFPDLVGSSQLNAAGTAILDATIAHALGR